MTGGIKKFKALSHGERMLFLEALFLQINMGLLLKIIPFRWIPRFFAGTPSRVHSLQSTVSSPQSAVCSQQSAVSSDKSSRFNLHTELLEQIKTATRRASYISIWKNKCLVCSLAARRMLNKRKIPSRISLGVAKAENGKMIAHAWLRAGDYEIVAKGHEFHELYSF